MGIGWVAAVIGVIMVVFSLNRIFVELRKGLSQNTQDPAFFETYNQLLERVNRMADDLDDINQSFYDAFERLEKRLNSLEGKAKDKEVRTIKEIIPEARTDQSAIAVLSEVEQSIPVEEMPDEEAQLAQEIKRLLEAGRDTQQIARELKKGVGEIELIKRLKT